MKIFNSLTGKKETFKPKIKREVSIYICGLTPYDDVHIGHARTFINFDVIVKFLRFVGFKVKYVRKIMPNSNINKRNYNHHSKKNTES